MSIPARFGIGFRLAAAALALLLAPIAARPQAAAGFRIAGRVVDSVTGDPVPRATVSALSGADNRVVAIAMTDAEGRFSIAGLAAGKYPLNTSRRGFRTAYYDEHEGSFNTAIVTGPDQDTTHLLFKLAPGAVIYGAITGDGGDPVQNASILLFHRDPAAPKRQPEQMGGTSTDDVGAYEFDGLPAGEYFIAVQAHPWYAVHGIMSGPPPVPSTATGENGPGGSQPGANSLDVAYPITFFDSTTDQASATPLDVDAGSRTQADISLHAVPAVHLTVPRPRQDSGPGILVRQSIFGSKIPMPLDIESVARGPWTVQGLPPGHYELSLSDPPRVAEIDATASMDIDPASAAPAQPVDVTVRMADGSPPGDVSLTLSHEGNGGIAMAAEVRNGKFQFPAVAPGVWTLSASSSGASVYVASVATAAGPLPAGQIAVQDRPVSLAVVLSRSQAAVTGFVRAHGKPVPGAMIVLVPRNPAAWPALARRDQSDSDGSFSLSSVPPGSYIVVAIPGGWNLDWQDRAVIARYLPAGEAVTIAARAAGVIPLPQPVQAALP
ncbi:MAG TPA: carboxypeptidase-like regulatory domain-containing protein [Terracidiphilus sp.]|nr:carboxypeptidase-like regulatory domain-containing protein [Terracidiphilus sp.]